LAIEQVGESVVITDPKGTIEYVNPAFERVTGYAGAEAIGQNPRILNSGKQDSAFYSKLWTTISAGKTFQARMTNQREDGSLFTEDATISPVFDQKGRIIAYVAVKRHISDSPVP
jgi:PAS domain S-box-containing protein